MRESHIKAFVRAVGPRVAHVTAAENLPMIEAHGLMSAHALALATGTSAQDCALRADRLRLEGRDRLARLNHQRPILHGRRAAERMVDGHTARSWAETLDRRVFFWPETKGHAFHDSVRRDLDTRVLWLDSRRFAETFFEHIHLSPINSGNFTQGGAHAMRGDWIYVPLSAGLEAFRENRRKRCLVTSRDSVKEISLTCAIQQDTLKDLLSPTL